MSNASIAGRSSTSPRPQVQIIQDLITQRVDGLAISVSDVGAAIGVIKAAREAGIPVITFDADAPGSAREAYIGTNNKDLGRALGEMLVKAQPHAGTYGMVSGGPAAANLNERLEGIREVAGKAGWKEVSGSPTYCNDDPALAVQQLNDLTTASRAASWWWSPPTRYPPSCSSSKRAMSPRSWDSDPSRWARSRWTRCLRFRTASRCKKSSTQASIG